MYIIYIKLCDYSILHTKTAMRKPGLGDKISKLFFCFA